MYPIEYLYSEQHEWILVEKDVGTVGITDYAQAELGEVVYVELPEVGQTFDAGDEIGTIESVKAVAEVYIPVAGEIVAVNEALDEEPETVNEDPHEDGWLVKIRILDPSQLEDLMDHEDYQELAGGSGS